MTLVEIDRLFPEPASKVLLGLIISHFIYEMVFMGFRFVLFSFVSEQVLRYV